MKLRPLPRIAVALCVSWIGLWLLGGCESPPATPVSPLPPAPDVAPSEAVIKRLTRSQYRQTVRDLLGDVAVPNALEPDTVSDGFLAVGASQTSISSLGVDRYESAAFDLAAQAMKPGAARDALVPCAPGGTIDEACAKTFVASFGRRAFRRPLEGAELARYVALATNASKTLGNFHQGLEFALAGILQSPHFLFRIELGEPDAATGGLRYSNWELATRLAYFLWNTTPDDALLDAAERGELTDDRSLERIVDAMVASPKTRRGVRNFFDERFGLFRLDDLVKDPSVFPQSSADLGPDAREAVLRTLEELVVDADGDAREMMTSRRAFVNRRLATLYEIPAPVIDGFGATLLPEHGERRGLLGQAGILALYAHATSSSSTLRGKFMRTVLLCGSIPPPPADVDTALPEPSPDLPTLRDRMRQHIEDPNCASCHQSMDPIGLGLETFDGIGRHRLTEQAVMIDTTGDLDGVAFEDPRDLGAAIAVHPEFTRCLSRHLYRYAVGKREQKGEEALIGWLRDALEHEGFRMLPLLKHIAMSDGLRRASEAP